jgi:hypothetical protein
MPNASPSWVSVRARCPVFATYRLEQTPTDRVARTLSAWSVTSSATIVALTALWGLLASITSPVPRSRSPGSCC